MAVIPVSMWHSTKCHTELFSSLSWSSKFFEWESLGDHLTTQKELNWPRSTTTREKTFLSDDCYWVNVTLLPETWQVYGILPLSRWLVLSYGNFKEVFFFVFFYNILIRSTVNGRILFSDSCAWNNKDGDFLYIYGHMLSFFWKCLPCNELIKNEDSRSDYNIVLAISGSL